jgi:phosphoribosylanthranilate isomerase
MTIVSPIDGPQRAAGLARPSVKICGLSDEATIDIALSRGAHEIGLVHFAPSPRHLSVERIGELAAHVGHRATVTVVTVNAGDALIDALAGLAYLDTIQLHGAEDPERVAAVRARTGLRAMKAIAVADRSSLVSIERYRGAADRILLDAKAPKGSAIPGGNGISFDWTLLDDRQAHGIVLSGGLNPDNVADAIRIARPAGIDVSSGVETSPGVKSADLIHRFFDAFDRATLNAGRQAP